MSPKYCPKIPEKPSTRIFHPGWWQVSQKSRRQTGSSRSSGSAPASKSRSCVKRPPPESRSSTTRRWRSTRLPEFPVDIPSSVASTITKMSAVATLRWVLFRNYFSQTSHFWVFASQRAWLLFYLRIFLTPIPRRIKMVTLRIRTRVSMVELLQTGTFEGRSTDWATAPRRPGNYVTVHNLGIKTNHVKKAKMLK